MMKDQIEEKEGKWYEVLCNSLGKLFKFPLKEKQIKDLEEKLRFCDLEIKPNYVYSTATIFAAIGIVLFLLMFVIGLKMYGILLLLGFLGFSYYLIIYPSHLSVQLRINATSELVRTVLHLVISLRLIPNLERALMFASKNVKGIVGRDLKRMLWGVSTGKYESAEEALDEFSRKWKEENSEFYEAMHLIKGSTTQKKEKREKMLNEAINVMLKGNMERMKYYSRELRGPLMLITTFGITLPVLTAILFPIVVVFLPDTIRPQSLFFFYDLLLPGIVYWIMRETLKKKPLSLGRIDISLHPEARDSENLILNLKGRRIKIPTMPLSAFIGIIILSFGLSLSFCSNEPVSLIKIGSGLIMLSGIAVGVLIYSTFYVYKNIDIREEIKESEKQFDEVLFQVGYILSSGIPLEKALEETYERTKHLKVAGLLRKTLENMRQFGFTFSKALFDKEYGVIRYYPSRMIRTTMSIIADSLEKGVAGVSKAILSISKYLKSMHSAEEYMKEILDETTSSMKMTMSLLVPITSGVVVGMATIMVMVLFQISNILTTITGLSSAYPQKFGPETMSFFVDIKNIIPAEVFMVVVGIYMIEVIVMLAYFISQIEHGGDPLDTYYLASTKIITGMIIFSLSILLLYFTFGGLLKGWLPA